MSRAKLSRSRNWAAAVFMMGAAFGTGCQLLVEVDDNQVPAALIPDGAVATDGGTDLPRADAPVDVPPETSSDAEFDASSDPERVSDSAQDSELDSGTDISAPVDATDTAGASTSD